VHIEKLHLEEDAGKTKNANGRRLIDFNRCGVPLIEMVTARTCARPMKPRST
jgi:aspartyl-tRNA(Asn)/glutamyl-tRNA(Gln) amidotransferase subunit B